MHASFYVRWAAATLLLAMPRLAVAGVGEVTEDSSANKARESATLTGPPATLLVGEALRDAVEMNDPAAVRRAIAALRTAGRSMPAADRNGRTALHEAAAWCG